jgi:hypothetical protein
LLSLPQPFVRPQTGGQPDEGFDRKTDLAWQVRSLNEPKSTALTNTAMLAKRSIFPRLGALLKFLNGLSGSWNISLFHNRNHGDDCGRVLAGIQVPAAERAQLKRNLDELSYLYCDESDNPAYRSFLNHNTMTASNIV